jgi:hypothetical protein
MAEGSLTEEWSKLKKIIDGRDKKEYREKSFSFELSISKRGNLAVRSLPVSKIEYEL